MRRAAFMLCMAAAAMLVIPATASAAWNWQNTPVVFVHGFSINPDLSTGGVDCAANDRGVANQDAFHVRDGVPLSRPETAERHSQLAGAIPLLRALCACVILRVFHSLEKYLSFQAEATAQPANGSRRPLSFNPLKSRQIQPCS